MKTVWEGNLETIHKLLQQNPLIFVDTALSSPAEYALHAATKAGQLNFVKELMNHKPELARESDKDGFRPPDIVAPTGNVEEQLFTRLPSRGKLKS